MSSDPQVNEDRQPSLMFPVAAGGEQKTKRTEPDDGDAFSIDRSVPPGDVVDTNWDIPKIEFSEDWPSAGSEVPLPPASLHDPPAERVQTSEETTVWDAKLDLDPSRADSQKIITPLFAQQSLDSSEAEH